MNDPGSVNLAAQPVDVFDATGLVTGISVAASDGNGLGGVPVASAAGTVVRLAWLGGACESRTRVLFSRTSVGHAFKVRSESSLGGMIGCPAIGVARAIDIQLRESIEAAVIAATFDDR